MLLPDLKNILVGLGWDPQVSGNAIDIDSSCILVNPEKQSDLEVVSFADNFSKDKSVRHSGDNKTGVGEGDDEQITVTVFLIFHLFSSAFQSLESFFSFNICGHDLHETCNLLGLEQCVC
jgi:hypothetical protein